MPEEFHFKVDRTNTKYSKAEIIASLKKYGEQYRVTTFRMREYDKWPKKIVCSGTIRNYFGSWGKALRASGLRAERSCKLDPKEMVNAFKQCWKEHLSVPSRSQLKDYLSRHNFPFRLSTYDFFGGLGRLAQLIEKIEKGQLPESVLYQRIEREKKRRSISLKDRTAVLTRDGYRCVKCGASPKKDPLVILHVDHIVPDSKGGTSDLDNLQTLCFDCNEGKKNQDD
jgi:5-methylcytosine-specific restriction endonuclease McrA